MASPNTDLEEHMKCSICLDIFDDPVVLPCSHSFCKACLEDFWRLKQEKACPFCRHVTKRSPLKNLSLKAVCESYVEEKRRRITEQDQGMLCDVHGLKHELFCTDDQKLVCLNCVSQDHERHNFCSINKAAEEHRNKLQKPLQVLETKLQTLISKKSSIDTTATNLQSQGQQAEKQITEEFKKLNQFLREEEEARLSALRDEQKRKRDSITAKIAEVDALRSALSEKIQMVKDDLGHDDSQFLHNFRATEQRLSFTLPDTQHDSDYVIDVAKHTDNLGSSVCEKMKQRIQPPVMARQRPRSMKATVNPVTNPFSFGSASTLFSTGSYQRAFTYGPK